MTRLGITRLVQDMTRLLVGAVPSAALLHLQAARTSSSFMAAPQTKTFCVDPFCDNQFDDPDYSGTRIQFPKQEFENKINQLFEAKQIQLKPGYAPFCKHLFVENFTPAIPAYMKITTQNQHLLTSVYEARTPQELPVLIRYFPKDQVPAPPVAKFLDVILYSREQIGKEAAAMGREDLQKEPWGIISVKAQDVPHELPMQPITMMRNALGKEEGGSGVSLSRDAYTESVSFWEEHALIK